MLHIAGVNPSMHLGKGCVSQHAPRRGYVDGGGGQRGCTLSTDEIATEAVGTHPTGMHTCCTGELKFSLFVWMDKLV